MHQGRRRSIVVLVATMVVTLGIAGVAVAHADDAGQQIDGKLLVAHGMTDRGHTVMQAVLRTSHGDVALRVPDRKHGQLMSLAGRKVKVRGQRQGATFGVSTLAAADTVAASRAPITSLRTAVILMHDGTRTTEDVSPAQAYDTMFTGSGSVANFYSLVSGGQAHMTGKVFGYYDRPTAAVPCDLPSMQQAAENAAAADGFKVSDFDYVVVSSPHGCSGFAGVAWVGASGVLIAHAFTPGVIEHEMGHNLGVWHGGSMKCVPFSASCSVVTYGDPTDVMGSGGSASGYGGYHLDQFGWLPASEIQTQSSGTQTYDLAPIDTPVVAGSTELVYVARGDGTRFTLERRQWGVGHNTWVQSQITLKLVKQVDSNDVIYLQPLQPNTPWTDAQTGISFIQTDATHVEVCFGACGSDPGSTTTIKPNGPTVTITSPLAGAHITGNIRVVATAPGAVRMELWVDGRMLGRHEGGTFSRQWTASSASVKPGAHTITVKAYDSAGHVGAASVTVTK